MEGFKDSRMQWTVLRALLGVLLISAGSAASQWITSGYHAEVVPLHFSLEEIPMEIGYRWAETTEIGDRVTEVLGADDFINRTYIGKDGRKILMHAAVWSGAQYVATLAPHPPQDCYTGAGWEILEQRTVALETPHGTYPCALILFERDGERIVTAHWYQMGRHHFTTRDEARKLHRRLWGQPQWPPTLKILLQVTALDLSSAQAEIVPFAQEVLKHTILVDSQS